MTVSFSRILDTILSLGRSVSGFKNIGFCFWEFVSTLACCLCSFWSSIRTGCLGTNEGRSCLILLWYLFVYLAVTSTLSPNMIFIGKLNDWCFHSDVCFGLGSDWWMLLVIAFPEEDLFPLSLLSQNFFIVWICFSTVPFVFENLGRTITVEEIILWTPHSSSVVALSLNTFMGIPYFESICFIAKMAMLLVH